MLTRSETRGLVLSLSLMAHVLRVVVIAHMEARELALLLGDLRPYLRNAPWDVVPLENLRDGSALRPILLARHEVDGLTLTHGHSIVPHPSLRADSREIEPCLALYDVIRVETRTGSLRGGSVSRYLKSRAVPCESPRTGSRHPRGGPFLQADGTALDLTALRACQSEGADAPPRSRRRGSVWKPPV